MRPYSANTTSKLQYLCKAKNLYHPSFDFPTVLFNTIVSPGVSLPGVSGLWPVAGPCGSGHPWKHPWTSARICSCCPVVSSGGGGGAGVGGAGGGCGGVSGVICGDVCDNWSKLKFIQI